MSVRKNFHSILPLFANSISSYFTSEIKSILLHLYQYSHNSSPTPSIRIVSNTRVYSTTIIMNVSCVKKYPQVIESHAVNSPACPWIRIVSNTRVYNSDESMKVSCVKENPQVVETQVLSCLSSFETRVIQDILLKVLLGLGLALG